MILKIKVGKQTHPMTKYRHKDSKASQQGWQNINLTRFKTESRGAQTN